MLRSRSAEVGRATLQATRLLTIDIAASSMMDACRAGLRLQSKPCVHDSYFRYKVMFL